MIYKFSELATVKTNHPDADFWLQRKGSVDTVGKPTKEFDKECIGIKIARRNVLDAQYCFYMFEYLHSMGYWKQHSLGTLRLQHITVEMVKNLKVGS